jgi:hypothetical protein
VNGLRLRDIGIALATAALVSATFWIATPASTQASRPARVGGKPNLNGIWQALNTANYELTSHNARAAMAMQPGPVVPVPATPVLALGAVGSVPGGIGVVEGDEIPYLPAAAAQQKKNQASWLTSDPEIKCYLPGVPRANYMPFPFQIIQSDKAMFFAYEYAGAVRNVYLKDPGPSPADSWMGQSVGKWEGDTFVIDVTGSIAPVTSTATSCTSSSATRSRIRTTSGTRPRSKIHKRSAARGRSGCRSTGTSTRMRGSTSSSASSLSRS